MIQIIVTCHCRKCGSIDIVKNGHDYKGSQKYHCRNCNSWGTLGARGRYSEAEKKRVVRAGLERSSLRGLERIFRIRRQSISAWILKAAKGLPRLEHTVVPPKPGDVLELDELWSFVLKKSRKRWIWLALCRRTRQVVAYYVGDRSENSCQKLWKRIPGSYKRCLSYSDFWQAYQSVFSTQTHQCVGKETGETAHVERFINTLRQRISRLVRKTLSFSKSDKAHQLILKLFFHYYNLECIS